MLRALYAQAVRQAKAACAAGSKGRITAGQIELQKILDQAAVEQKALEAAMGRAQKANAWLRANWSKLKALGAKGQRAHELHERARKLEWKYFSQEPYYYFEGQRERMKALFGELDRVLRQGAKQVGGGDKLVLSIYKSSRQGAPPPKNLTPAQAEYARRCVAILAPVITRLKKEPLLFVNSNNLQPTGSPKEHQHRYMLDERHTELLRLVHAWRQCQDAPKVYGDMAQANAAVRQARGEALAAAKQAQACYARAAHKQKALVGGAMPRPRLCPMGTQAKTAPPAPATRSTVGFGTTTAAPACPWPCAASCGAPTASSPPKATGSRPPPPWPPLPGASAPARPSCGPSGWCPTWWA